MNLNLQYLALMSQNTGLGFLDIKLNSIFGLTDTRSIASVSAIRELASWLLLSDLLLYVGMLGVIVTLGKFYKKYPSARLVKLLRTISLLSIYISLVISIYTIVSGYSILAVCNISLFGGSYTFSMFSQVLKIMTFIITIAIYIVFPTISSSNTMRVLELPLLIQVVVALCITMLSSTNYALLLLALEGFSLTSYVMTALGRNYGGVMATVKYFAFGTLGSIFLFWGTVHFYALVPSLSFDVISHALETSIDLRSAFNFASTAIMFGFMLKLGAAPVHQWVADVYAGAHMYITMFFAIFVKFILFVIFLKVSNYFNCDALVNQFILFSLIIGCFMSINQSEIKRLLAYSSIVHVAFLLMGDTPASLMYIISYVLSSFVIFSVLLTSELGGRELVYLNDLKFIRGSGFSQVIGLTIALASAAGLPPFAGFYGKFLVWSSLIEDIYLSDNNSSYFILLISLAVSLVTIFYYMRIVAYLFIGEDNQSRSIDLVPQLAPDCVGIIQTQWFFVMLMVLWTPIQAFLLPVIQFVLISI